MTQLIRSTVAFDASFLQRPPSGIRTYVERMVSLLPTLADEKRTEVLFLNGNERLSLSGFLPGKMQRAWWDLGGVSWNGVAREADLLHVPYLAMPVRSNQPVVVTVHDVIPWTWPEYRRSRSMRLFMGQIERSIGNAAIVIVPSRFVADQLPVVLKINTERIRIVPMGVDLPVAGDNIDTEALARYGLQSGRYLFNIGGFDLRKNLAGLVRAFALVAPELGPVWKLVIGGSPHTDNPVVYPPIEPLISDLGLGERIILTGRVDDAEKTTLYCHAGVYVTPSLDEGFGLTAIEAMSCGVPTIVSNRGSFPEVVGDGAIIVDPSAEALAEAIRALLSDESSQQILRRRGIERASRYAWSETARKTLHVYREILE